MMEHGRNQILRLSIHGDEAWDFANVPEKLKSEEESLADALYGVQLAFTKAESEEEVSTAR